MTKGPHSPPVPQPPAPISVSYPQLSIQLRALPVTLDEQKRYGLAATHGLHLMTALISPVRIPTIPRRQRASVMAALGLSAGAVGWSGLANAAGEETASQVLLLPDHYELIDNGVVVFELETGETLSLTEDQYLIMEDGLLLITDELAQASVYSLPVMGSIRAQLLSDLAPIATIDGMVAEATPSQTMAITQGTAPRLSEQVNLQSYELAQSSDGSTNEVEEEAEAVALSLLSPGAIALLGMLMTSDQVSDALPQPHPYAGQIVKLDDIHPGADINDVRDTDPRHFVVLDGKLYFGAREPNGDYELYVYDPLTGETTKVASADVNPTGSTNPNHGSVLDGKLYFSGRNGDGQDELYV